MAPLTPTLPGYRDLQLIAHGTTSVVFRALQERLNRTVAIKLLLVDQAGTTPEAVARELATMVKLSAQPHIVSVIDTGTTEDGRPYTVMDFCEGGSYAQILAEHGPLPIDDVLEVGTAIGEALHAAHHAGVIHRDVKPSNILRSRFGPALADFGIARGPDELAGTLTREMMTPHHASPEALLHQAQSSPSDVYSLASTMWTLLVGHPPFVDRARPALDLLAFRDRVLHEPLPAMPREDVPEWLTAELSRAMSKMPSLRHASAKEFAGALRRGALGLPPNAPTYAPPVVESTPFTAGPQTASQPSYHAPGLPPTAWPPLAAVANLAAEPSPAPSPPVTPWSVGGPRTAPRPQDSPAQPDPPSQPNSASRPSPSTQHLPLTGPGPASAAQFSSRPTIVRQPSRRSAQEREDMMAFSDDLSGGWRARPAEQIEAPLFDPAEEPRDLRMVGQGRRGGLVVALLGITVIVAVGAVALIMGGLAGSPDVTQADPATDRTTAAPVATATRFVTAVREGAPSNIKLRDDRTSVTLTWTDPTSTHTVPVAISTRHSNGSFLPLVTADRGVTRARVEKLDPKVNYCFTLTAIYAADHFAAAAPVCTDR